MDEEDGRPGAVARKSGHMDAHADVPTVSLCRAHPTPRILDETQQHRRPSLIRPRRIRVSIPSCPRIPAAGFRKPELNLPVASPERTGVIFATEAGEFLLFTGQFPAKTSQYQG
jgi:hypothetical protein